jgi:hypothetical protein
MPKEQIWIITTDGNRPIRSIAKDLADAGLIGGKVLTEICCITGSAPDKVAAKLRKVQGVIDVSPDMPIDVGPPDSTDTW